MILLSLKIARCFLINSLIKPNFQEIFFFFVTGNRFAETYDTFDKSNLKLQFLILIYAFQKFA